jgi:hypothetical protein
MQLTAHLRDRASRDASIVARNARHADRLSAARHVDFILKGRREDMVKSACSIAKDCQYGDAWVEPLDQGWVVVVRIFMQLDDGGIFRASGLMLTLALQFGLEYGGWKCFLQVDPPAASDE